MKFIRSESDEMSKILASERGVFPAFEGSKYDSADGFEESDDEEYYDPSEYEYPDYYDYDSSDYDLYEEE